MLIWVCVLRCACGMCSDACVGAILSFRVGVFIHSLSRVDVYSLLVFSCVCVFTLRSCTCVFVCMCLYTRSARVACRMRVVRLFSTAVYKQRWLDTVRQPVFVTAPIVARVSVDSRESALISSLQKFTNDFSSMQMLVGDVRVCDDENHEILIERKTVEDLYSSIKSRRLFDQLSRLFEQQRAKTLVVLVVEGSLCAASTPPCVYYTVTTTCNSLLLRDRISLIRTDNIDETAKLVISLQKKIHTFFKTPSEFANLVHVEQKTGRKISGVHLPYLKLLMSIKGVSANRAESIAKAFPTMESLLTSLRTEGTVKLAQMVAISNSRATGSPIGLTTAVNIAEAILGPNDPLVAEFKLLKLFGSQTLAKKYKSISNLRSVYLSSTEDDLPESVRTQLSALVDDPQTLLSGLKGVKGISSKTAETICNQFGSIRKLHEFSQTVSNRSELITFIRMLGAVRMIAKPAVENILNWLHSEGYVLLSN